MVTVIGAPTATVPPTDDPFGMRRWRWSVSASKRAEMVASGASRFPFKSRPVSSTTQKRRSSSTPCRPSSMRSRSSIRSPLTGATWSHATFTKRVFHTGCMPSIYSIGHGMRPIEEFIDVLRATDVKVLADIRSAPGSRRHPQFGQAPLAASLAQARIDYVHLRGLGGRRDAALDSPHVALRVDAFRGYADHMASAELAADYARLHALASEKPTAFMCAETL